jgi:hypothetical protein
MTEKTEEPKVEDQVVNPDDKVEDKQTDQGTFKEAPKEEDKGKEPVVEETVEPKVEDTADDDKELDQDVWGSTGDDVGDSVLQLLQNSGTTPETAKALLWDAVQAGDATKIDRDALVEAVGKTKANLIMAGMENYVGGIAKRAAEVTEVVNNAVGGNENWKAIRDWAKKTLSDEDMADYADMIDKGGRKASLAAKDLKEQYEAAGHTFAESTEQVTPSGKPKQETLEPLTKREYFEKLDKLNRQGKLTQELSSQLFKQRQLGIAQGK